MQRCGMLDTVLRNTAPVLCQLHQPAGKSSSAAFPRAQQMFKCSLSYRLKSRDLGVISIMQKQKVLGTSATCLPPKRSPVGATAELSQPWEWEQLFSELGIEFQLLSAMQESKEAELGGWRRPGNGSSKKRG